MVVSRDSDCSPPSNTWDSFTLVGHSDGATNTSPPQEGKRGEEKKEDEWSQGFAMIVLKEAVDGAQEITICPVMNHTGFTTLL